MNVYRLTPASVLLFLGCGSGVAGNDPADLVSVDDILLNNHSATRPGPLPEHVRNTDKTLQISEGGTILNARYRATSQGRMRIDVFVDDARVYSEGLDKEGAWEWPGGQEEPEDVHHDGAGALAHGIEFNLFTLAELASRGHTIELADRERIRGTDYFVLKVTLSDGFETYRFVNADTWRVDLSRDFRAFHPGMDETKQHLETRYDQWDQADGVLFASRSRTVDIDSETVMATTTVMSSKYNVASEELGLSRKFVPDVPPNATE